MPGVLDIQNNNRQQALGQMGYLSALDSQRTANNNALHSQAKAQRNQSAGSGLGMLAIGAATGNPVSMVMGGVSLLGSLF